MKHTMIPALTDGIRSRPKLSIFFVSLVAVLVNCFPVLFSGKSFVSPYCVSNLVYRWWPPLPGIPDAPRLNQQFSDTGAIMWNGVPNGFLQSRAILEKGELPLWNRFSHGGAPLLGQGLSMFGDPFHFVVILGKGSAEAWDLKFVLHRLFFCFFLGLFVLTLFKSLELSLIFSFLGAYYGGLFFAFNHEVFFVLCYSSWILYSGVLFLTSPGRLYGKGATLWLASNLFCFNAGFIELAPFLIGGVNSFILAYALIVNPTGLSRTFIFKRMTLGTLLFLGLSAPTTVSFLVALRDSFSLHEEISCPRLPAARLLNLVDGIFQNYEWGNTSPMVVAGGNFLLFTGLVYSALNLRQLLRDKTYSVALFFTLLWTWMASGYGSDALIKLIPLVNRNGHTYSEFSNLSVLSLLIVAAAAVHHLMRRSDRKGVLLDVAVTLCISGALVAFAARYLQGRGGSEDLLRAFLISTLGTLACFSAISLCAWAKRIPPILRLTLILTLVGIGNFRYGFYRSGADSVVRVLGARTSLNPESPSMVPLAPSESSPFRSLGLQDNFVGDYFIAYNQEDIRSCAPLMNRNFIELMSAFPGVKLNGWTLEFPDPIRALPLLNLLNVKYMLAHPQTQATGVETLKAIQPKDFAVFENLQAWPRAFFSPRCHFAQTIDSFVEQIRTNAASPFIAFVDSEADRNRLQFGHMEQKGGEKTSFHPAENYRLLTNSTEFDIDAPSSGFVCLTETQASDFRVTVGGVEKKLLHVNKAFKGVFIETPGRHRVVFTFRPRYWNASLALFIMSLLAAAWFGRARRAENL